MTATRADHLHGPGCAGAPAHPHPPVLGPATARALAVSLLVALAGISTWVLVRNPLRTTVFPPCPFREITGLWCPGCGATRASYLLFHGDVAGALHFNALWVVVAPFALYAAVAFAGRAFGVRWLRALPFTPPVVVALMASVVGFGIVRNLPFGALDALNPLGAS